MDAESNIVGIAVTREPAKGAASAGLLHVPPARMARVDNCLLERQELRERVVTLLDAMPKGRRAPRRLVKLLAMESRSAGDQAPRLLVDLYLAETSEHKAEAISNVLQGLPRAMVQASLVQAAEAPVLTSARREKLELLTEDIASSRTTEAPPRFVQPMQLQYSASELVEAYLEALEEAQATEPEAVGLVWLRGFRGLPDAYRAELLRALAERRDPTFMPVFELEARNENPDVRRAVAGSIGLLRVEEALELALRLEFDADVMVRYDAAKATETLRKLRNLPRATQQPNFDRCFCLAIPGVGAAGLLYAVRASDGTLKFCSLLLDTWHRGIVDAWGNVGCDESQLAEVVLAFSAEVAQASSVEGTLLDVCRRPKFSAISRAEALELIRNSVAVSRERGRKLPAEFPLWERLFRFEDEIEPTEIPAGKSNIVEEFVFDLHCTACSRRIAVNRTRTNLSVHGEYAFCSKCLSKERECTTCTRGYRLGSVSGKRIRKAFEDGMCTRCAGKAEPSAPRRKSAAESRRRGC